MLRAVDPAVFTPRPRVDSALLRAAAARARRAAEARELVRDCVRPPPQVAGALARARAEPGPPVEAGAARALGARSGVRGGRPRRGAGAPRSSPALCARLLGVSGAVMLRAPAKLNLCLYVGPTREDGLHEICSLFEPLALADELEVVRGCGDADEVICAGVERPEPGRRRRSRRCASGAGARRRCGSRSRSGSRSRPASAAAAPTPRRCCGWPAASWTGCRADRGVGSAPTCPRSSSRALCAGGGGGGGGGAAPAAGRPRRGAAAATTRG